MASKPEDRPVNGHGSLNGHGPARPKSVERQNKIVRWIKNAGTNLVAYLLSTVRRSASALARGAARCSARVKQVSPGFHARMMRVVDYVKAIGRDVEIWFDSSFRNKVLLPVVGCTAVVLAITFFVARHQMATQSDKEARQTLATADAALRYSQDFRRHDLLLRFHNLPSVPLWNQLFQAGAPRDLHNTLRTLMEAQKVDIVFYASSRGKVLDTVNNPGVSPTEFEEAAAPALELALRGDEKVDTVRVAGKLYDVVALPAFDSDNKRIGAVGLGLELGDSAAQEFSKLTQSQVALVADGRIIASTLPGLAADPQFGSFWRGAFSGADNNGQNIKPIIINGIHYYCLGGHFESVIGDDSLGYVLLSSREQALADKRVAQRILAVVSLLAIFGGAFAVGFFVHRVSQPLRELRQSAEAVGRGDFKRRVPVESRDECGQLALVFNQMTGNLEHSRSQLEKTVETLKNTQEQLVQSEKLSAIGEFVAGVAHELNNPLTTVVGFSELLIKDAVDPKSQHYSDRILKAAMRCKKIVQSLLSFARGDKPKREPVCANELIDIVLDIVAYTLRTSNIEVVTDLAPDLPFVQADAQQIQQVLLNIITNAQQAIESNQPRGRVLIATKVHNGNIRIIVQDDGPGIPPENLPRLFDPFFTTKSVGKGTGLGLSLCYGFIKEHGGNISATSQYGQGAVFTVELPAVTDKEIVRPVLPQMKELHEGHGKRVLVVDDEEPILSLIREDLAAWGYKVEVTSDGENALRQLEQNRFDLAVCDWKMPGINGRQIYEQLRASNPRACRRVIFITGDVINPQMRHFLEAEKRPCLSKPFTLPEFHTAVEDILNGD